MYSASAIICRVYQQLMGQFELLRRHFFIAEAERVDATQLEFEKTKQKLDALARQLDDDSRADGETESGDHGVGSRPSGKAPAKPKAPSKGRQTWPRQMYLSAVSKSGDPALEASGAAFIDWELSYKLGYQRPEAVRVVIARAKYKVSKVEREPLRDDAAEIDTDGSCFTIATAPLPPLLIRRGFLRRACSRASSVRSSASACRSSDRRSNSKPMASRSTAALMARSTEDIGACLGAIVIACVDEARKPPP